MPAMVRLSRSTAMLCAGLALCAALGALASGCFDDEKKFTGCAEGSVEREFDGDKCVGAGALACEVVLESDGADHDLCCCNSAGGAPPPSPPVSSGGSASGSPATGGGGCPPDTCEGTDGKCYGPCQSGTCTLTPSGNCSAPSPGGVYCCAPITSSGSGPGTCGQCDPFNDLPGQTRECSQPVACDVCSWQSCAAVRGGGPQGCTNGCCGYKASDGTVFPCDKLVNDDTCGCEAAAAAVANYCCPPPM
jgi:hypothetical protein